MSKRWDEHFLNIALECAKMSKDRSTKVGAVLVGPDREIRGTGFNGLPRGIADTDERLLNRDLKLKIVVHAEINAVMNAARVGIPVKGCTLFLSAHDDSGMIWGGPPCTRCTVELIQTGIVGIVSRPMKTVPSRWIEDITFAGELLKEAGLSYRTVPS